MPTIFQMGALSSREREERGSGTSENAVETELHLADSGTTGGLQT